MTYTLSDPQVVGRRKSSSPGTRQGKVPTDQHLREPFVSDLVRPPSTPTLSLVPSVSGVLGLRVSCKDDPHTPVVVAPGVT